MNILKMTEEKKQVEEISYFDGVDLVETPDKISIEITGKSLANLRELHAILNRTTGEDLTMSELVHENLLGMDWWADMGMKKPPYGSQTLAGFIVDWYDGDEAKAIDAAFKAAGYSTER